MPRHLWPSYPEDDQASPATLRPPPVTTARRYRDTCPERPSVDYPMQTMRDHVASMSVMCVLCDTLNMFNLYSPYCTISTYTHTVHVPTSCTRRTHTHTHGFHKERKERHTCIASASSTRPPSRIRSTILEGTSPVALSPNDVIVMASSCRRQSTSPCNKL